MQALNLNSRQPSRLPASEFPEPSNAYFCVKCGKDITKYLHRIPGHARRPFAPLRYVCACGEEYLSGAAEWDERSDWEQRCYLGEMGFGALLLAGLLLAVILAFLAFHRHPGVLLAVFAIALVPSAAIVIMSAFMLIEAGGIAASIWRTRVRRRFTSGKGSGG